MILPEKEIEMSIAYDRVGIFIYMSGGVQEITQKMKILTKYLITAKSLQNLA